jgi:DNA-binding response OmpR family regulator
VAHSILIADDHEEMRQLVVELLETQGYEARQAADTAAVLEQVRARRPDLLILDVNMPGEGGIAALRWIRENEELNGMRVLVLSGSVDLAPEWLTELGADAHLPKPFPIDELNATVRRLLPG